jgi:ribosomal protein S18 acetylase RimI-like enzyme
VTIEPPPPAPIRTDLSDDALRDAIVDDLRRSAVRRRGLAGERVVQTPSLLAYASDVNSADANEVAGARFGGEDTPDVDRAIQDAIALFGGRPFLWWVGPDDEPADLSERLSAHGIVFLDEIPGMAMDLGELSGEAESPPPPELDIAPVLDAAGLRDFHAVLTHGFPEDWTDEAAIAAISAGAGLVAAERDHREPNGVPIRWLGPVESRAVATTRLHTAAGVAGVYAVITIEDARRRGYGAAMTRHALLAARAAGLRIGVLQASAAGRGIYERIGFREHCRFRLHEWRPMPDSSSGARGEGDDR